MAAYLSSVLKVDRLVEALGLGPWSRQDLLAAGWLPTDVDRAIARRLIVRIRRGLYGLPDADARAEQLSIPYDARRARMQAMSRRLDARAVFSHDSAAYVHGLWTPGPASPLVHVTVSGGSERLDAGLKVHSSRLPDEHIVRRDGLRVTTVARTAVDLALGGDLPSALVAADSALRHLVLDVVPRGDRRLREGTVPDAVIERMRAALLTVAEVVRGWPGSRVVPAAMAAADPRSESAYESWSRGWILAVGLPRPEVNGAVVAASGRRYFGDLVWRERGLIGEVDGVAKYGRTGAEVREALRAERERQSDLEAAGWRFVRWVPGDPGATVVARVGRALYLGRTPVSARSVLGA